jgi:hypothetical protein
MGRGRGIAAPFYTTGADGGGERVGGAVKQVNGAGCPATLWHSFPRVRGEGQVSMQKLRKLRKIRHADNFRILHFPQEPGALRLPAPSLPRAGARLIAGRTTHSRMPVTGRGWYQYFLGPTGGVDFPSRKFYQTTRSIIRSTLCACQRPPFGVAMPRAANSAAISRADMPAPFNSARTGAAFSRIGRSRSSGSGLTLGSHGVAIHHDGLS